MCVVPSVRVGWGWGRKGPASLREDSPGQEGAGRGPTPPGPSSGAQRDEGPGPQGAVASVHRDHWPRPVAPVTPLLVPASPPGTADTQRSRSGGAGTNLRLSLHTETTGAAQQRRVVVVVGWWWWWRGVSVSH